MHTTDSAFAKTPPLTAAGAALLSSLGVEAMESTLWSYQTLLDAEPRSASKARKFVSHHLADHRLPYLSDPVRLIASELATNAIRHARTEFTVRLTGTDEEVVLRVEDQAGDQAPTVRSFVAAQRRLLSDGISGRGLAIVALLSHDWGVTTDDPGYKTVWASFAKQHTL